MMSTDEQAIRDLQATWFAATANGDIECLRTLMTDDVVFLAPGRAPFGRDEFTASFTAGCQVVRISCTGELEEVVVAGDVAYARGLLKVTVAPRLNGEPNHMAGYTLSVFRRQIDGRWLLARDANLLSPVKAATSTTPNISQHSI